MSTELSPQHYINRELSQLAFNQRVLAQALDTRNPLLERLKFLSICSRNMDEFFEIRVAGLKQQIALNRPKIGPDGLAPAEVLKRISAITHEMVKTQYEVFSETIIPELQQKDIHLVGLDQWTHEQAVWARDYFSSQILPVLSPIGLDFAHPFPRIVNKSLNFIFALEGHDAFGRDSGLAIVHAPRCLPRIVKIPNNEPTETAEYFVLLSSLIQAFASQIFPGMTVKGYYQFRVTRNSDLDLEDVDMDDLALALQGELSSRRFGDVVRLEVSQHCPENIMQFLMRKFQLSDAETYRVTGLVNFNRLLSLYTLVDRPDLKFSAINDTDEEATYKSPQALFDRIKKQDILLHHPFQPFTTVVEFLQLAASDPNVLAIRQTLYRTGPNSVMVRALIDAAKSGKEVTAVIELRARFDEEENIELAKRLQEAGALVVYGVQRYKTHAKMTLVVRRENSHLTRYVHLGTGNYHTGTTRQYTDIGLLTAHPEIGEDVHNVFQQLSGMGIACPLKLLLQAPFTLHTTLLSLIEREMSHAQSGKPAKIIAKLNALTEPKIIEALYKASQAGVKIQLIVRGICSLCPGLSELSENIHVYSIIGRYLEHSRVYYFENNGEPKIYCASADWMERNLFSRIEVCFPILDTEARKRIISECIEPYLKDTLSRWELQPTGQYLPIENAHNAFSVQEYLLLNVK